jgi:hypothetical protein
MSHLEYLVRHGPLGDIGRFRAPAPLALPRGRRVVVRGPRGTEVGEVVRPAGSGGPGHGGELLREVTADDEARQTRLAARAAGLAAQAADLAGTMGVAVTFLDCEVQLDAQHASLVHVSPPGTPLAALGRRLEQQTGLLIALIDLTRPEPEPAAAGCGDCGSGGCGDGGGCGSGGCGSGSCGSARPEEVQAFFADLRKHGERRVALL